MSAPDMDTTMVQLPRVSSRGRLIKLPKYLLNMEPNNAEEEVPIKRGRSKPRFMTSSDTASPIKTVVSTGEETSSIVSDGQLAMKTEFPDPSDVCSLPSDPVEPDADDKEVPVRRGRGRPRLKPSRDAASPDLVVEGSGEKTEKRGRGRPRLKSHTSSLKEEIDGEMSDIKADVELPATKPLRFGCIVCGTRFGRRNDLRDHERTHAQVSTQDGSGACAYVCNICTKQFSRRSGLVDHMRTHSDARPHVCSVCGKAFLRVGHLKCHMMTHSGERPHACDVCGHAFVTRSDLRRHADVVHAGVRAYLCTTCGKACSGLTGLVYHRRTHTGEKPYVCVVCGHAFSQNGALREHARTHTGEKPYVCTTCGRAFATSRACTLHTVTHTGLKSLLCGVCGRAFNRHSTLREHQKTHTGVRPYACPCCGRAFAKKSTCRMHILKRHKTVDVGPVAAATAAADIKPNMGELGVATEKIDVVGVANTLNTVAPAEDIAEILLGISAENDQTMVNRNEFKAFGVDSSRVVAMTQIVNSADLLSQPINASDTTATAVILNSVDERLKMNESYVAMIAEDAAGTAEEDVVVQSDDVKPHLVFMERTNDAMLMDGVNVSCVEVTTDMLVEETNVNTSVHLNLSL